MSVDSTVMMRRRHVGTLALAWWLWAAASAAWSNAGAASGQPAPSPWALQADIVFRHQTAVELQYASVLVQDDTGFIWAGTDSGMARWDGYRTRRYTADAHDPTSIPAGSVRTIEPDGTGGLWVGTSVSGIAHYDPRTDSFVARGVGPGGLQDSNVGAIVRDGRGGLWVGTATGLDHVDTDTGAVQHATGEADRTGAINAIVREPDGGLWLGTELGLLHRAAGANRFENVPLGASADLSVPVRVLCRDHAGRLWIGTHRNGLLVLEPGQAAPRGVRTSRPGGGQDSDQVRGILDAGRHGIWVSMLGTGLTVIDPDAGGRVRHLQHRTGIASSLLDDDVTSLCLDRSGVIWVSTTMGLSQYNARADGVWTLFGDKGGDRPVGSLQVPAVLAHPDGRIWLSGGTGGGATILDAQGRRVGTLRPDASRPRTALPIGLATAFAAAADGSVLIGTTQGLYRADAHGRHVERIAVPQRTVDAPIYTLAHTRDGRLWIGGTDGLRALTFSAGGAPTLVAQVPPSRLSNRRVTALVHGGGDILWVGTETGLNRLHMSSGVIDPVVADAADPDGYAAGYVSSLLIDSRGRLWVGAFGSGLQVTQGDSDQPSAPLRFHHIGVAEGLPNKNVDALVTDARGTVWASTDNGLAAIDPATLGVRALGEPQGVALLQYWSAAAARLASGELLFGGVGGLTVVQPDRQEPVDMPPPLVVTEATVGGRLVPASQFNGSVGVRRIAIQPGERDLSLEFSALDYAAPEQNRYSYRLVGYDQDWIPTVAGRRLATYTNLPPGDYTLQLRGSGPDMPWTPTTLDIAVRVLPRWYQSAWFRLGMVLACGGALVGVVQARTGYLQRRQRELHALVALRTQELQESQRQLEQIAYSDALTGLANRRRFNEEARSLVELALRGTVSITLLLIDLDRFKHVNDTLGHDAGDALLAEVARRLVAAVRQGDRVARLGGDEFAVIMPGTEAGGMVEQACRRIIESLGQPFEHVGRVLQVGASIGVAACPHHARGVDALYKCADTALYDAKRAGRNTWRIGVADTAMI